MSDAVQPTDTIREADRVPVPDSVLRALPHSLGLLLVVVGALAVGRPEGWLGALAALGPLLGAGVAELTGRRDIQWREAFAFGLVAATMIAGGWAVLRLPDVHELFVFVWPIALLAFLLGVVNFVAVSLSRTWRAVRGQPLDYPWIPGALARVIGVDPEGNPDGNR